MIQGVIQWISKYKPHTTSLRNHRTLFFIMVFIASTIFSRFHCIKGSNKAKSCLVTGDIGSFNIHWIDQGVKLPSRLSISIKTQALVLFVTSFPAGPLLDGKSLLMVLAATVRIHRVVFPTTPGVGPSFPAEETKRIPFSHAQSSFLSYRSGIY